MLWVEAAAGFPTAAFSLLFRIKLYLCALIGIIPVSLGQDIAKKYVFKPIA
jgi:hypothetical protein